MDEAQLIAEKWDLVFQLLAELRLGARDSCIERSPRSPHETIEYSILQAKRRILLSNYMAERAELTEAAIYRAVMVDRRDWTRWKKGRIKDSSVIAQRIEKLLKCGEKAFPTLRSPHTSAPS